MHIMRGRRLAGIHCMTTSIQGGDDDTSCASSFKSSMNDQIGTILLVLQ